MIQNRNKTSPTIDLDECRTALSQTQKDRLATLRGRIEASILAEAIAEGWDAFVLSSKGTKRLKPNHRR